MGISEIELIIVGAAAMVSIIGTLGILINRIRTEKGIGIRIIQFAVVTVVFPFLVILTLLKILPPSSIAIVAGTIIGYAFAKSSNSKDN